MLFLAYIYKHFLFPESTWNHTFQNLKALKSKPLILHIDLDTHTQIHRWMVIRKMDIWGSITHWLKFCSQYHLKTLTLLLNTIPSSFLVVKDFQIFPVTSQDRQESVSWPAISRLQASSLFPQAYLLWRSPCDLGMLHLLASFAH